MKSKPNATKKGKPPKPPADPNPLPPSVYVDTTYIPPSGQKIKVNAGGNLQNALNTAQPGDWIAIEGGANFVGPFTLPAKSGAGYIYIQTDGFAGPPGQRVAGSAGMATLLSTGAVVIANPSSHHFRFIGVNVKPAPGINIDTLIELGTGSETSESAQPHHIIFDRCCLRGDAVAGGKRGVSMQGSHLAVIDSRLCDWKRIGQDSQAIAGWNGPGPFKIVNNFIEGAGENVMFGGADTAIRNLTPSDIEIRQNHFFKPLSWKADDPSYAGVLWTIKNLLELKHAQRVIVSENLLENNWGGQGQNGYGVLFTGRNQSGGNRWAMVSDVTFEWNALRNSTNGINMLGQDNENPSAISKRLKIAHNLATGIGAQPGIGVGIAFLASSGYEDVNIDHNTMLNSGDTLVLAGVPLPRLRMTNNIVQHNKYGIKGDGANSGNSSISKFLPNSVITKNVFATPVEAGWEPYYPPGNYFPATLEEVGFMNYPENLKLSASSPYHNAGTDGTDLGY